MTSPLLSKFDNNVEVLLTKFQEICQLASIQHKSYEVQSVEALQIESDAWTIVRIAEELLSLTRSLKESWVLGQAGEDADKKPTDTELYSLYQKVNNLLDDITR